MILEDKILDFIEAKSKIKDGEPPRPSRSRSCGSRTAGGMPKTKKEG